MLLAVDVGNTRVKAGLYEGCTLLRHFAWPTDRFKPDDLWTEVRSAVVLGEPRHSAGFSVAVCSVVPAVSRTVAQALDDVRVGRILWIGPELDLGLSIGVDEPERLGPDRIANAVAAVDLVGCPVIAMSYGTAITLTVVDSTRVLAGGAIAPGPEASARGLAASTGLLPLVDPWSEGTDRLPDAVGANTESAIRSGLIYGAVGTARELVAAVRAHLGDAMVVMTGGYASLIAPHVPPPVRLVEHLTLEGVRLIAERNPSA